MSETGRPLRVRTRLEPYRGGAIPPGARIVQRRNGALVALGLGGLGASVVFTAFAWLGG